MGDPVIYIREASIAIQAGLNRSLDRVDLWWGNEPVKDYQTSSTINYSKSCYMQYIVVSHL